MQGVARLAVVLGLLAGVATFVHVWSGDWDRPSQRQLLREAERAEALAQEVKETIGRGDTYAAAYKRAMRLRNAASEKPYTFVESVGYVYLPVSIIVFFVVTTGVFLAGVASSWVVRGFHVSDGGSGGGRS